MKGFKMISAIVLATAASAAFAVGPAPEYWDPKTNRYVERTNIAHEVPAFVWAFGPHEPAPAAKQMAGFQSAPWAVERSAQYQQPRIEVAGFQPQPWAVERSAHFLPPFAVARTEDDGSNRGRL
jgi:hypothetical protein